MAATKSLIEVLGDARARAQTAQGRISVMLAEAPMNALSDENMQILVAETVAIEAAAIDIFAVFEARMQHHFKRGPFARKLKSALLADGKPDLADKVHQTYLAINVLKHGTGASYRELAGNKSTRFVVKPTNADGAQNATGLIDVTDPAFFDGLAETIVAATDYLEGKKAGR